MGSPGLIWLIPYTIASIFPSTSVAVISNGSSPISLAASARSSRRAPISWPSIRDDATDSALKSMRANASVFKRLVAVRLRRAIAVSASVTSAATFPSRVNSRLTSRSGR